MKTYAEQISAIKGAIKYKEHEYSILQKLLNERRANTPVDVLDKLLAEKKEELSALRDAGSSIIALQRDEKLFLASGDLLEALNTIVVQMKNQGLITHHWKKHIQTAQLAINKATL